MFDFRELREKAGFTQEQLAERMGVSKQAISKIELGRSKPTVENAKKLGEILHFDWTAIYESA